MSFWLGRFLSKLLIKEKRRVRRFRDAALFPLFGVGRKGDNESPVVNRTLRFSNSRCLCILLRLQLLEILDGFCFALYFSITVIFSNIISRCRWYLHDT